jgi:radical SAM protein with 4Fe4S-binding SPASM domain
VHCSVSEKGHPHHRQNGFLDPGLIQELFDDLEDVGAFFDTLILFWLGEPLIHPNFAEIYQGALRANKKARVFGKIELHTNGTHLDAAASKIALNDSSVPQVWHFSLDAARQDTYTRIKGMDRFALVEQNIERFVEEKASSGAKWPRLVFQFILSSANAKEAPQFAERWQKLCTRLGLPVRIAAQHVPPGEDAIVFFRQLDCPTAEMQAQQNAVFRETIAQMGLSMAVEGQAPTELAPENLRACSGFWKSPVIGWNGDVTVCTRDNRHENKVGNLKDKRFSELWWSAMQRERRAKVAVGDYSGLDLCQTCFIPKSSNYTEISPEEIAEHQAWEASCK